jgi:putative DeoR family transcriptional regulator (stage III sporulation protein D)
LKGYIEERAMEIAVYIIEHNATVRQTAKQFGVSKSTVHKDLVDRLPMVNPSLAQEARKVLDVNKSERHIRGGMATKEKYLREHKMVQAEREKGWYRKAI